MAGVIDPDTGYEPAVFNRILPGVSGRRLPLVWSLPDPRTIHSHTTFRSGIPKAVYVVRDGRDAVVSFFHYSTTRNGVQIPFNKWFELYSRRWYGPRWHDHVESWLTRGRKQLGENLMVVKFEDLKDRPLDQVQHIADFLGLPSSHDLIAHAIDMASIEKAREREARVFGKLEDNDQSFYRGGRTGQYRDYLQGNLYERFLNMSATAMSLAAYENRS